MVRTETTPRLVSRSKPEIRGNSIPRDNDVLVNDGFYWRDIHKDLHKGEVAELLFVAYETY